jgi:ribonuclease R
VIVVDADGRTRDIVREQRTVAHRAVEEAMLAANRAVANRLEAKDVPTIYRIHEPPLDEKLAALCDLLQSYGLVKDTGGEALSGQQIHRALRNAADRPEAALVNLAALRSMAQARYDTENRGHFALGFDSYLHFTSPIRRYADLVVHRALKRSIGSSPPHGSRDRAARGRLSQVAFRISERERAAVEAEREIGDLRACAFMASRVGEVYSGIVTGVAAHGLYVRLDEIFVEGLVHVSRLPEQVELDEARHALVAVRSGRRYRLGDALRVRVEEVNQVRAWINFGLPTKPGSAPTTKSPAGRSKPRARRQDVPSRGRGRRSRPGSRRGRR